MSGIKLVVFDIAGTIIEDHGEVVDAFSAAMKQNGIAFSENELKQWKGASKREVIRHFVADRPERDEVVEATYRSFRSELERMYDRRLHPIQGAQATFAWCRHHGILLATTTGFYREISDFILGRTGWHSLFAANISSSDVTQGRPAPYMIFHAMEATRVHNVNEVVNVGDTPLDLQAGANAAVAGVIGVLTGEHSRESLKRERHSHIISSVAELPELIERAF